MVIFPVIHQIVICQKNVHLCRITLNIVFPQLPFFHRMHHTGKFTSLRVRLIQTGQQDDQKCHIIIQKCLSFFSTELF